MDDLFLYECEVCGISYHPKIQGNERTCSIECAYLLEIEETEE